MGIYSSLIVGRDAVMTHQRAIEVTGHNISNANTPGYTRQRLMIEAKTPLDIGIGQMGSGVTATGVERIYDKFLGDQINNAAQDLGRWEAQRDALGKVEVVFDETDGYGLNYAMSEFWNAWQDLSNNPSGSAERTLVLAKSQDLVNTLNTTSSDLNEIQDDLDQSISVAVDEINLMASQIDDLNGKIESIEASGQDANDYRDERDRILKELANLIDFSSTEGPDGRVTVSIRDAAAGTGTFDLVGTPSVSRTLQVVTRADGHYGVEWSDAAGDILDNLTGGKLNGWDEVRDVSIEAYLGDLDSLAANLITEVNGVHALGYGLDGNNGRAFFSGSDASDISVDAAISGNVNFIAAARPAVGWSGEVGDNTNAIAIANLQHALSMGGTATFDDYYNSIVSDVGIKVQESVNSYDYQDSMAAHLDNYRESISGVSIDEEMVNLVRFQHAYEAAAKLIVAIDEMLETLIRMV